MRWIPLLLASLGLAGCYGGGSSGGGSGGDTDIDAGGDDAGVDAGACPAALDRLSACGLFGEGEPRCVNHTQLQDCNLRCVADSSCTQLRAYFCDADAEGATGRCRLACNRTVGFGCANGDYVPREWACDGFPDCQDASDESGCDVSPCEGGNIPPEFVCDGTIECPAGEDESGCPEFACRDGQIVPASAQCDGEVHCEDASDELGCPEEAQITCE